MAETDVIKEKLSLCRLLMSGLFGVILLTALYIFQNIDISDTILFIFFCILSLLFLLCFLFYLHFLN